MKKRMKDFFVSCAPIAAAVLAAAAIFGSTAPAWAHFQMVYTPEPIVDQGEDLNLKLIFTHPFDAEHTMDMATPRGFFVEHRGRRTDLRDGLRTIGWKSLDNEGVAYEADFSVRTMGDYVFVLEPEPYFEEREDGYIQQFTKLCVNVAGLPTDWDREIGMPAEIVPLDKPYAVWAGSTFRGLVKGGGKPVPYAEVEVEFLNHRPLTEENRFDEKPQVEAPHAVLETITLRANGQGEFVFGIPWAGWWGFAAIGAGPETEHEGKELSQDGLIWVYAHERE